MIKTLVTAAFASISLIAVAMPAQAANLTDVSCDTNYSVSDNEASIIDRLSADGVAVQSVEDWSGCVRAYVTKADGSTGMVIYDPVYLTPLTANAIDL